MECLCLLVVLVFDMYHTTIFHCKDRMCNVDYICDYGTMDPNRDDLVHKPAA